MTSAPCKPDSCAFVIFGATGDLTHRLVIPALYNLAEAKMLPEKFCIVAIERKRQPGDKIRDSLLKGLRRFATRPVKDHVAKSVFDCLTVVESDPSRPNSFDGLKQHLDELGRKRGIRNHLFYLAVPPDAFLPISQQLGRTGLLRETEDAWRRVIVEKPFGHDFKSAQALNAALLDLMDEDQIYRIDHYLGKETVQNILMLRFANGMFEPVWNRNHIDHVQITVSETLDIGSRGKFYETTGALRDMVPNHLFQLLSFVAMEPPSRFDAQSVRAEKAELLDAIQSQNAEEALRNSVRGQYLAGTVGDKTLTDYRKEKDVSPRSDVETYVALKLVIDNWRWAGVPFYLRTGKALAAKRTEVAVCFKAAPFSMFRSTHVDHLAQNYLVIGIEPTEGIDLQFSAKVPGPDVSLDRVQMTFRYADYFHVAPSTGYETLIYDCMTGDNLLFQRADSIEAGWRAVQPFLDAWSEALGHGLTTYRAGSTGPDEAAELLERDGRHWRSLRT